MCKAPARPIARAGKRCTAPARARGACAGLPVHTAGTGAALAAAQGLATAPRPRRLPVFRRPPRLGRPPFCPLWPAENRPQKFFAFPLDKVYLWRYIVYIVYIRF